MTIILENKVLKKLKKIIVICEYLHIAPRCQKLENNLFSKIDVIKKCAPKLTFFNEKKIRKIPMIFDIEN